MYFNNVEIPGGAEYQSPGVNAVKAFLAAGGIDWGAIITQVAVIIAFGAIAYFTMDGIGQKGIGKMVVLVAGFSVFTVVVQGVLK